jgi:hypothetical protein
MKFNNILKKKYSLLNEAPPADLDATEDAPEATPESQATPEQPAPEKNKLDTQGVQYLVDLIRKALLIDKLDDKEKASLLNLTVTAENAFSNLENTILPILNKYIPDTNA